jgi:hypothetical protein
MNVRPAILCPVDYSDASAGALRYAAALAEQFVAHLVILTVESCSATRLKKRPRWFAIVMPDSS